MTEDIVVFIILKEQYLTTRSFLLNDKEITQVINLCITGSITDF